MNIIQPGHAGQPAMGTETGMEAWNLVRGDRVFIDGRWRKVRRAELLSDGTVSVETLWSAIRNGSWTFAPHDVVPTRPRTARREA